MMRHTPALTILLPLLALFSDLTAHASDPFQPRRWNERKGPKNSLDFGSLWARSGVPETTYEIRSPDGLVKRANLDGLDSNLDGSKFIWLPEDTYQGRTFFDEMKFFTEADPTSGMVKYVNRDRAFSQNYTYFEDDGTVVMRSDMVSTLPLGEYRESVRIETNKNYTGGLFILDLKRAPWGCAIWPAFWTTNANWPRDGEIDILEGVHDNEHNQVTWHTLPGCYYDAGQTFTGTPVVTPVNGTVNCDSEANENSGCGITEWSRASYGPYFESQGGGVLAMKWDENGIAVWSFFRAAIPRDVVEGAPNPSLWGPPSAVLGNTRCNITQYFRQHVIVFDITFCGVWAGNSYATTDCPGTCPERLMDPKNFENATWHINYLKTFYKQPVYATPTSSATSSLPWWLQSPLSAIGPVLFLSPVFYLTW